MEQLGRVITELAEAGLIAKLTKCCWGKRKVEYLGHLVREGRVAVCQDRVKSTANPPELH